MGQARVIILKARQMGFSTLLAAFEYCWVWQSALFVTFVWVWQSALFVTFGWVWPSALFVTFGWVWQSALFVTFSWVWEIQIVITGVQNQGIQTVQFQPDLKV